MSKEERRARVAEAVAKIVSLHGVEALNFSRTARTAKVSRAWLYKYLGANRSDLVHLAVDHFAMVFSRRSEKTSVDNLQVWIRLQIEDFDEFLSNVQQYPWAMSVYMRYKGSDTIFGERIREMERRFFKKSSEELRHALPMDAKKSLWTAEMLTAAKVGLAHHWSTSTDQRESRRMEMLMAFHAILIKQFGND